MLEPLRDAAGNVLPTNDCACGRPKLAQWKFCCVGCPDNPEREHAHHSSSCSMRCATMGVPGFGVRASEGRELLVRPSPQRDHWRVREHEAASMREAAEHGLSQSAIARRFGVCDVTVSHYTRRGAS